MQIVYLKGNKTVSESVDADGVAFLGVSLSQIARLVACGQEVDVLDNKPVIIHNKPAHFSLVERVLTISMGDDVRKVKLSNQQAHFMARLIREHTVPASKSNTDKVQVHRMRKKLRDAIGDECIVTVHGQGYRLRRYRTVI